MRITWDVLFKDFKIVLSIYNCTNGLEFVLKLTPLMTLPVPTLNLSGCDDLALRPKLGEKKWVENRIDYRIDYRIYYVLRLMTLSDVSGELNRVKLEEGNNML